MNETVLLEDTSNLAIKGANKVVSSTQNQAVDETASHTIVISGTDLEVKKLDLDNHEVCFSGKITNIKFSAPNGAKQPFLKRIFK